MQQTIKAVFVLVTMTLAAACGKAEVEAPVVTFTPDSDVVGKPSGPIAVAYRIIGKPVVGQPVAIELVFDSSLGDQPLAVVYRINDATGMRLADSQPSTLTIAPAEDDAGSSQRVTVIPMREGRLYLNVSASVETGEGSMGTVTAIPIQVGDAPRLISENGTAGTDENGNAIRALPAEEQ